MVCRWLPLLLLAAAIAPPPDAAARPTVQGPESPLPIERALDIARQRAPLARAAAARLEGATASVRLAGRIPNPSLEVRGENWTAGRWGWTPGRAPDSAPGIDFFTVLTQPIELGARRSFRRALAEADRDVAALVSGQVAREAMLDTLRAYLDALRSREVVRVLDENREGLAGVLTSLRLRVKEGFAAESDLMKLQAEFALAETELGRARIALHRALGELTAMLGEPITGDRLVMPRPALVPDGEASALAEQAVAQLPEVAAARARAARARNAAALERALRWPDAAVSGGYKRTAGMDTAVAGLLVSLPVFDRNGRNVAIAESEARAADFEVQAATATLTAALRSEIEAARLLAGQANRAPAELLAPAEGVRTAARSSFREGAADVLKLVDAERVYLEARRAVLELRLDAFDAAARSRLSLGKEIFE